MNFTSQFDSVVSNMIGSFGGTAILKIKSDGTYSDGEYSSSIVNYNVNIAVTDYPQNGAGEKSNFNTLILEGDKQCFVQPPNKYDSTVINPTIRANQDTIKIGNTEWKILNVKEINPSSVNVIVYELHLRK